MNYSDFKTFHSISNGFLPTSWDTQAVEELKEMFGYS